MIPHDKRNALIRRVADFLDDELDNRAGVARGVKDPDLDRYEAAPRLASRAFREVVKDREDLIQELVALETWLSTADGSKAIRQRIRKVVKRISGKGWEGEL